PSDTGTQTITSAYGGEIAHVDSSGTTQLDVHLRSTATTLTCSPNPVAVNTASTCTAAVRDTDSGAVTTPSGPVDFTAGGSGSLGASSCTLSPTGTSGLASCSVGYRPSTTGPRSLGASFGGDSIHTGSDGGASLLA